MNFPNQPQKYDQPSILTAKQMAAYRQQKRPFPPTIMILCYQPQLLQHAKKKLKGKKVDGFYGDTYLLKKTNYQIGIAGNFGIGAPVTAVLAEDFIAWGVQQFLIIGLAGTISPTLHPSDIVIANKAIRDEGTSHHYLPSQTYVDASPKLTTHLQQILEQQNIPFTIGATWTTDAPYRETAVEVEQYQQEGVLTVEMEAAALFAVAQYYKVEATAVFCISDSIGNRRWQPTENQNLIHQQLTNLFDTLAKFLTH